MQFAAAAAEKEAADELKVASTVKTRRSSKSGMSGLFGKQTQAEIANADSLTQYRALKEDIEAKGWKKKQRGCVRVSAPRYATTQLPQRPK